MRWVVAVLATIVVLVAAGVLAFAATGGKTSTSAGPTFLPADTPVYVEARLDLPGGQRDAVIQLFSRFPGFADQASFDTKIDRTLDDWLSKQTSGAATYTGDIKPWFGGQISVGLLTIPATSGLSSLPSAGSLSSGARAAAADSSAVIGLTVKDKTALDAALAKLRQDSKDLTFTDETYDGSTLTTVKKGDTVTAAYAVTDTLLLAAGSPADVKTALDVLTGKAPSLASNAAFSQAMAKLPAERLGAFYARRSQVRGGPPGGNECGGGLGHDRTVAVVPGHADRRRPERGRGAGRPGRPRRSPVHDHGDRAARPEGDPDRPRGAHAGRHPGVRRGPRRRDRPPRPPVRACAPRSRRWCRRRRCSRSRHSSAPRSRTT